MLRWRAAFRFIARGELLAFEHIERHWQARADFARGQLADLFHLLFRQPQGVLVVRDGVAPVADFFPEALDVAASKRRKRSSTGAR